MKTYFELERWGDDAYYAARRLGGRWNLGSRCRMADPRLEPCVWRTLPGFERGDKLSYRRDYSRANGSGSRGVYAVYELDLGRIYEVRERISWGRVTEYHIIAEPDGCRKLTKSEIDGWAKGHLESTS